MRSMTGYGRGTCEALGRRLVVELRSVNHRFLEVKLRLPWPDAALEAQVTQLVRKRLDRGVVSVAARDEGGGTVQAVHADLALARAYAEALTQVARAIGHEGAVPLSLVVEQPGVLVVGEGISDPTALFAALRPGLEAALAQLIEARAREGAALETDLRARRATLGAIAGELKRLTEETPELVRKRLRERLDRVLQASEVDPQRIAQEVAFLADRADVSEELTRLDAHLAEMDRLFAQEAPSGRRLDFLVQELNREVNTIGSKSQSAQVAAKVVDAKAELERLREQIQNVE